MVTRGHFSSVLGCGGAVGVAALVPVLTGALVGGWWVRNLAQSSAASAGSFSWMGSSPPHLAHPRSPGPACPLALSCCWEGDPWVLQGEAGVLHLLESFTGKCLEPGSPLDWVFSWLLPLTLVQPASLLHSFTCCLAPVRGEE